MPGILSGAIIVFALAASAFATPAIIGGRRLKVASTLAYDEFLNTLNWPLGAAVAVLLLVALVADRRRRQPPGRAPLRAGVRMSRNGPLALVFHALFVTFMLAPILVVCCRRLHARRLSLVPDRPLVAALVLRHRPLSGVHPRLLAQPVAGRAVVDHRRRASRCRRRSPSRAIASAAARRSRRCSCRR